MTRWGTYFFPAFVVVFLSWASISAFVMLNRALYERRRRSLSAAQKKLAAAKLRSPLRADDRQKITAILAGVQRKAIVRVAVDSTTPRRQAEAFSAYLLETLGVQRLTRASSNHRGERQKWARVGALRILTLSGYRKAIHWLEWSLSARDPDVVGAAVILLGSIRDEKAAQVLTEALRKGLYPASRIATQLDRFALSIPHLIRPLVLSPLSVVRFWGATLLGRYAGSRETNRELASLGKDPDADVRKAAVESLGKAGGPYAAQTAVVLIGDPVWYVRAHAARALGDLQRVDLCKFVAPLLSDSEWWVRISAKEALQAMGEKVEQTLIPYLDSPDKFARNGAAEILQNVGILDALIGEAIEIHKYDPERVRLIRNILAAGGPGLLRATMARTGTNFDPSPVQPLRQTSPKWPRSA